MPSPGSGSDKQAQLSHWQAHGTMWDIRILAQGTNDVGGITTRDLASAIGHYLMNCYTKDYLRVFGNKRRAGQARGGARSPYVINKCDNTAQFMRLLRILGIKSRPQPNHWMRIAHCAAMRPCPAISVREERTDRTSNLLMKVDDGILVRPLLPN